jgi:hypothetical protein
MGNSWTAALARSSEDIHVANSLNMESKAAMLAGSYEKQADQRQQE